MGSAIGVASVAALKVRVRQPWLVVGMAAASSDQRRARSSSGGRFGTQRGCHRPDLATHSRAGDSNLPRNFGELYILPLYSSIASHGSGPVGRSAISASYRSLGETAFTHDRIRPMPPPNQSEGSSAQDGSDGSIHQVNAAGRALFASHGFVAHRTGEKRRPRCATRRDLVIEQTKASSFASAAPLELDQYPLPAQGSLSIAEKMFREVVHQNSGTR